MKHFWIPTLLFALSISFTACKKDDSQNANNQPKGDTSQSGKSTSAVVIFSVGDCHSENRKLTLGDSISEKDTLFTGKKSMCDIQILESDAGIVVRIKAESEFRLNSNLTPEGANLNLALKKGSGLFKINQKLAKNQSVKVVLPTMVAGVRGTSFSAEISKKGDVDLQVSEGSVSSRPLISELEALPDELKTNSQTLRTIDASLSESEQVLEAGQKITIPKSYTDKILKDTGLKIVIPQIQESIKKGDLSSATQKLDSISGSAEETKVKIKENLATQTPVKVEKSQEKDIQTQLKEFEELIAIEKQKLDNESSRKTEITARNKTKQETLMKRIEQITGKSTETLILRNGTRVQGVIIQEGDTYHVLTTEGKKSFPESAVEGTEF